MGVPLSPGNPRLKQLRRLLGRRSARRDAGLFVLEGPTLVEEALRSGMDVVEVFVDDDARSQWEWLDLVPVDRLHTVRVGVLDRILDPVTPRPVAGVVALPDAQIDEVVASAQVPLVVVLAGVSDPGNVGTLVRGAVAAGATAVVVTEDTADPFGPKAVRASAGAVLRLPIIEESLVSTIEVLAAKHIGIVVTRALGGVSLDAADLTAPIALVLGNEAHGIPEAAAASATSVVSIPMEAGSESLNVAMAGTVLLFEAARQRRSPGADHSLEVDGRVGGPSA